MSLEVRDNGKGISEEEINRPSSLGIFGMRERVEILHGEMRIHRNDAGGTTITARIPLRQMLSVESLTMLRILIVDDYQIVRRGIKEVLADEFSDVSVGDAES